MIDHLLTASAAEQLRALGEGITTAADLVEACLGRIAAVNPAINAVVQIDADRALAKARKADTERAAGNLRGPLHGLPFTVKDWIEGEGLVCAAGYAERAAYVPNADATVVARMRAAGAILLGKTNVLADNPVYGPTRNPYDPSRTPGPSSSGEAAVVAAGGSPLGLGSDSGGSLRFPAHCCGIATLKPTNGRVPNTGHFPRISALNDPRTQIGPLARSVRDLALVLPIIAGPDGRDAGVVPVPLSDPEDVDLCALRVAFHINTPDAQAGGDTERVLGDVVNALSAAGIQVTELVPQGIEEAWPLTLTYWARLRSLGWSAWEPDGIATLSGEQVDRSLFEWDRYRRRLLRFMDDYDVVVCPAAARAAGPHGAEDRRDFVYTLPFSLTGWPVAVVRAGTATDGLPIGVQIAAKPWRDDVALAVAQVVEEALGGWRPPAL